MLLTTHNRWPFRYNTQDHRPKSSPSIDSSRSKRELGNKIEKVTKIRNHFIEFKVEKISANASPTKRSESPVEIVAVKKKESHSPENRHQVAADSCQYQYDNQYYEHHQSYNYSPMYYNVAHAYIHASTPQSPRNNGNCSPFSKDFHGGQHHTIATPKAIAAPLPSFREFLGTTLQ